MSVREFVKGEGGMCGAIFIDEQFEAQAKRSLGKRWTSISPSARKQVLDSQWENGIKKNFDGKEQELTVTLPAEAFSKTDVLFGLGRRDSKKVDLPIKNGKLIIKSYVVTTSLMEPLADQFLAGDTSNSGSKG